MTQAVRKLNFMLKNDVADELEKLVPSGKRSKLVNDAIVKELALFRRRLLTDRLLSLRAKAPVVAEDELLAALHDDRKRG